MAGTQFGQQCLKKYDKAAISSSQMAKEVAKQSTKQPVEK